MQHPFVALTPGQAKGLFWPAFALVILLTLLFRLIDPPPGVVAFEVAGNLGTAQAILGSWNAQARLLVAFGLGIDYLYMVAYSTTIGLACIWAARTLRASTWPLAGLGALLAWGLWVAALSDATENVGLLAQLVNGGSQGWAQLSAACATVKFLLVIAGLIYAAYGGAAWLRNAGRGDTGTGVIGSA